jgi:hypothetical protein
MMAIPKGYKHNLNIICKAAANDDLCILECNDAKTGEPVIVICAANRGEDEIELVPLAKMFDGNPYEEVIPPELERKAA